MQSALQTANRHDPGNLLSTNYGLLSMSVQPINRGHQQTTRGTSQMQSATSPLALICLQLSDTLQAETTQGYLHVCTVHQ